MRKESTDNRRKGGNYEIKRRILAEILKSPLSRSELKDRLTEELGISRKDIDYHIQRGENSLLARGIVKEENGNLMPIWDSKSILQIVKFFFSDKSLKDSFNRALSESYRKALFILGLDNSKEYDLAIDNWKDSKITSLEVVVETLLRAYTYDSFLNDELSKPNHINVYSLLSPSSYPYDPEELKRGEKIFEYLPEYGKKSYLEQKEQGQKYLDSAIERLRRDLLNPLLYGSFTSNMRINYDNGKRELLSKLQQADLIFNRLASSDLDKILHQTDKINGIYAKTLRIPKNKVKDLFPRSRNRLFGLRLW